MNITRVQIIKLSVSLIAVACLTFSCTQVEKRSSIDYQDTLELLNLSLGGKGFNNLLMETRLTDKSVYIALDSADNKWPKQIGNVQIETIMGFNKQPDVIERAYEKRFVVSPPVFEFKKDSAKVAVYSFKFHLSKVFKFAKEKNKWMLISENEYQY